MSSIIVETIDGGAVYTSVRHCPKCGGEVDAQLNCIDCTFSEETSLTREEAMEFTSAG